MNANSRKTSTWTSDREITRTGLCYRSTHSLLSINLYEVRAVVKLDLISTHSACVSYPTEQRFILNTMSMFTFQNPKLICKLFIVGVLPVSVLDWWSCHCVGVYSRHLVIYSFLCFSSVFLETLILGGTGEPLPRALCLLVIVSPCPSQRQ